MKPKKLHSIWLLFDILLIPLMYIFAGTVKEKPQETHGWHIQQLSTNLLNNIDFDKTICAESTEVSKHRPSGFLTFIPHVLFHIPLLGGWRDYVVLTVPDHVTVWHIGWIVKSNNSMQVERFQLHKLPLTEKGVRMLTGLQENMTYFYAVNSDGLQIQLTQVGEGEIGDGSEYKSLRLL